MSFFDSIILNAIFILFPIGVYLLLVTYLRDIGKKENELFFDLANLTSLYLIIRYSVLLDLPGSILFINIPFLIAILYNKKSSFLLIAAILMIYYVKEYNFPIYYILIEYFIYFLLFVIKNKKKISDMNAINCFIFVKGFTITIYYLYIIKYDSLVNSIIVVFLNLLIFYLLIVLIFWCLKKEENVISFNTILKELEKEKALKNSLFKITHELKNPIAVCKGYLSMIDYNDLKSLERYHEIIKSEIDRTLDIMDNFSAYTKIVVNLEPMDLCMLVEDVLKSMEILFKNKNIVFECNLPDEVLIDGDYNRLKQVLVNVLKNSSEAIEGSGKIKINVKERGNKILLSIKDNGCGMDKDDIDRLEELFYSTKEKGCGIGVPLSFEIIKLHHGQMKYESKKGIGTTVKISFLKPSY